MSISYEEGKKAEENVYNFLNTLDLLPYLNEFKGKELDKMMDKLEEDYPYKDEYSSAIFDYIARDEFMDYLNKKYNARVYEVCPEPYYIVNI